MTISNIRSSMSGDRVPGQDIVLPVPTDNSDGILPRVRQTMSVKSFCEASTLCKSTAHKLIRTGRLEATTVGTRRLIYVDSVQALLAPSPAVGKL